MPPFKARSRAEIAAEIEKKSGKTSVWATIPIFDQNRDPWPVILTTLSAGYGACFPKIYPNATNEFGHTAMGEGTSLVQARRFDRPEQPLLACIEEYYRSNNVPGPGGNPIRVAFDEGSAQAATLAAAKEREALVDAIKKDEDAKEASGAPGGTPSPTATGPAAPGGSPGGSGPGGSGPGGSGPGGSNPGGVNPPTGFPLPPSTPPSGGPLPPTSGPEVTPELPGGTSGPVNITDLDTQDSPNPRDTLDFDDTSHELLVLGSVFDADVNLNEVRLAGGVGASIEADIVQMETPPGGSVPTGIRFSLPDAAVAGKDLNLTVTNSASSVNGTPGPVTSPAKKIQVRPVVTRVFTDPLSGPFGVGVGGTNVLIPGKTFKLTGQGFAASPTEMEVKVNKVVATIQAIGASGDGDPSVDPTDDDAIDVLCPASGGGTLGAQVEVTLTVRKGTPNETTIVVTPSPTINDPNNPAGNPQILSIENTGGTTITEMGFASAGTVTVVLVGRNFATTANLNRIKWNGELLAENVQLTYGPVTGAAGSFQRLQLTFNATGNTAPILRGGNTQLVLAVLNGAGTELASAATPIKVKPFIFAIQDCAADDCGGGTGAVAGAAGTVQENQSFYLSGWGFGSDPGNVSLGIGGLTNVARETAAFLQPGGVTPGYRIQFKMGNFTNLATGASRAELGRMVLGGVTYTIGGVFSPTPDFPLNNHVNVMGTADP